MPLWKGETIVLIALTQRATANAKQAGVFRLLPVVYNKAHATVAWAEKDYTSIKRLYKEWAAAIHIFMNLSKLTRSFREVLKG